MQGPRFNSQYQKQKKGSRYVSHQSSDSWEIRPRNGQSLGKKQDRRAPLANSRRLVLMESWPRQRQCQGKRQEAGPEGWLEMYRAMQPCQGLKQSVRGNKHRSQQAGMQRCQVLGGGHLDTAMPRAETRLRKRCQILVPSHFLMGQLTIQWVVCSHLQRHHPGFHTDGESDMNRGYRPARKLKAGSKMQTYSLPSMVCA